MEKKKKKISVMQIFGQSHMELQDIANKTKKQIDKKHELIMIKNTSIYLKKKHIYVLNF